MQQHEHGSCMALAHAPPVQLWVNSLQGMLPIQVHQHPSSLRPVVRGCLKDLAVTPRPSQQFSKEGCTGLPSHQHSEHMPSMHALFKAFLRTFTL